MGAATEKMIVEREAKLSKIYLAIISRYKDYIEEKEGLSVAELPTLVMPNSEKVAGKANEIKSRFINYTYEENFHEASLIAFQAVKREVNEVILPLQFWLTPEETLEFMMGDQMDKNILLCSLLIRLGNPSSKVFVKMSDATRGVFVYYAFKNRIYLFDFEDGAKEFPNKEAMLVGFGIDEDTTAYEFNNQMYADIS